MIASFAAWGADTPLVGVIWGAEPEVIRWQVDEQVIRARLDAIGATYTFIDSGLDTDKQNRGIRALVDQGVRALLILPHDVKELMPMIARVQAAGIPIVAYDRAIPANGAFFVSFDTREVGRMQAGGLLQRKPSGSYAIVLGDAADPNSAELYAGQMDVLRPEIERGNIQVDAVINVPGWRVDGARSMTAKLLQEAKSPFAAILAANDGLAGGVIAALDAAGKRDVAVSGQDGDVDAIRRIASGTQTLTVFKDSRLLAAIAVDVVRALAFGKEPLSIVNAVRWKGVQAARYQDAIMLQPVAIDRDNLGWLFEHGYVPRDVICANLRDASAPAPCW